MKQILVLSKDIDVVQPLQIDMASRGANVILRSQLPDVSIVASFDAIIVVDLAEFAAQARQWLKQLSKLGAAKAHKALVAYEHGYEIRLEAFKHGVERFFRWPVEWVDISSSIMSHVELLSQADYRALVVDDDEDSARIFSQWLAHDGFTTQVMDSPEDVLVTIQNFNPDVLVLDLYMPNISGLDIANIIRQDSQLTNLPIIFVSVEQRMQKKLYALDQGADYFLSKPFDSDVLVTLARARAKKYREQILYEREVRSAVRELDQQQYALNKHAIVSIADSTGVIRYVNDCFCDISGYSRDELLGQNHRLVKSSVHPASFYRELWLTISGGQVWRGEVCNRRKDGSHYWIESTIVPLVDSMGMPYRYISIRTDITHIKEVEEKLSTNEERFRRSQNFANIGTWDWNIQTGDLFWSERIPVLFGYEKGELETNYDNFLAAVHDDDRQSVIDAVSACVEKGEKYDIEHRCVWPDGTIRWLVERGDVVRDKAGKPLHMLGMVQDITDRKQAELVSRELQHMLRMVLDTVPVAVYWKDKDGRYAGANTGFSTLLGLESWHELVGQTDLELPWAGSQGRSFHQRDMLVMQEGYVRQDSEVNLQSISGDSCYFFSSQVPLSASEGQVVGMLGVLLDINERRTFEQQLVSAKEDAERASQAKSNFLSGMSHELRTPLNSIIGFAQLLEMQENLPEESLSHIAEVRAAGGHILRLINDVLDLAKIESGKIDIDVNEVELQQVLNDCAAISQHLLSAHSITLKVPEGLTILVKADGTRLRQILLNLVSNAIKYNRDSGSVIIDIDVHEGLVKVAVKDTGAGVEASRIKEMFQPFSRLSVEAGIEGTGLGLAISRDLVELMGGELYVISEPGVGTEVGFTLNRVIE